MAEQTPAVDSNALAAPASGFGQTVSFAFNPNGQPPQLQRRPSGGPRGSVQATPQARQYDGGAAASQVAEAASRAARADPTGALLTKLGGEVLQRNIDEARSEQYVRGMQRAMSGEAVKEIADQQPWYAKLFGDTPEIEGARAYSAQDAVNKALTAATANISQIQHMGSDEASQHFAGLIRGAAGTGDRSTDALIMKTMAEQMPGLMKAQAKVHYAWRQNEAVRQMDGAWESGAANLQQMGELYSDDKIDNKAMAVAGQAFVRSIMPPEGMSEETWTKMAAGRIRTMAENGQFHPINALKQMGIYRALSPEQQTTLDKAIETGAVKYRDKYAFTFANELAQIKSVAVDPEDGQTVKALEERIDRFNAKYQKATGSPVAIITSDEKVGLLAGNYHALRREEEKAAERAAILADRNATATAKATAAAQTEQAVTSLIASGDWKAAKALPGVDNDLIELVTDKLLEANKGREVPFLAQAFNKGSGNFSQRFADKLQADMKTADAAFQNGATAVPEGFFKAVNTYRALRQAGGPYMADAYFGDYARQVAWADSRLGDNVLNNPSSGEIFRSVMSVGGMKPQHLDSKEQVKLIDTVTSAGRTWMPSFMGGHSLRPDAIGRLSALVNDDVGMWKAAGFSNDVAVAKALNDNLGPQLEGGRRGGPKGELLGGHFIERLPGSGSVRLFDAMASKVNIPEELRGKFFQEFVKDRLNGRDGELRFYREPSSAGDRWTISGLDKNGAPIVANFGIDDLKSYAGDKTKWIRLRGKYPNVLSPEEVAEANADLKRRYETVYEIRKPEFGPEITFPRAVPSPYASAAERAAFRAKQAKQGQQP